MQSFALPASCAELQWAGEYPYSLLALFPIYPDGAPNVK